MTLNLSAHLHESPVDALTQMSNAPRMGKPDTQIGALGEETLERSSRGGVMTPNLSAHLRESPVDTLTQMSNAPRMGANLTHK